MARWSISYEATVTVNVEAETEKEAIEAADKKVRYFHDLGEDEKGLSIEQLYLVTNDDTGEAVFE